MTSVVHYQVGDQPIPGYQLRQLIGAGPLGQAWKSTGPGGAEVALKILPFESADLTKIRNLRLITHIKHPNLVPILALWLKSPEGRIIDPSHLDGGRKFDRPLAELILAMGLGDKSLATRLKECLQAGRQGVPEEELLDYVEAVARGVDHLAQPTYDFGSGPVAFPHCNIKPTNILIVGGAAQLGDVGLSLVLGNQNSSAGKSACYQAPELFTQGAATPTSDQYSLAITYVELRTGVLPFQANSLHQIISAHLQGLMDLSRLPEAERGIIKKALHADPTQRWGRAVDMVRALRQVIAPAAGVSLSASAHTPTKKRNSGAKNITEGGILLEKGLEIVPMYKLIRPLGRGGYGEVWEAAAPGNLRVAMKIVRNLEANTGRQEFKALQLIKNVNHVYLLALHAYWLLDAQGEVIDDEDPTATKATPSMLVLATRLADRNLMQRLKECRQDGLKGIPPIELIGYMRQAAAAIDYLNAERHQLGDRLGSIQHRDIKPENILLTGDVATVADFGLAKLLQGANAHVSADSVGLTLLYAAPELLAGSMSNRSDQYSLGITYYFMRTGSPPFAGDTSPYAVIQAHTKGQLDLSQLPEAERLVIARATHLDPPARYPQCSDMINALEAAMAPVPTSAKFAPVRSRPGEPPAAAPPARSPAVSDTPGYDMANYQTVSTPPQMQRPPRPPAPPAPIGSVRAPAAEQPTTRPQPLLHHTQPAPPPAAPEPPRQASWKGEPAAAAGSGSIWLARLRHVLVTFLIGSILGGAGWAAWLRFGHLLVPDVAAEQARIAQETELGRFPEALTLVTNSHLTAAQKDEARDAVRARWVQAASGDAQKGDDARVAAATERMLEFFSGDPRILELRRAALDREVTAQIEQALQEAQPPRVALKLLDRPHYDSPAKEMLKGRIRQRGLDLARTAAVTKGAASAAGMLDDLAGAFPNDKEINDERRATHGRLFAADFQRAAGTGDFEAACKLLEERKEVLGAEGIAEWQPRLVAAWLDRARQEKDKKRKEALLQGLLAYDPSNREAQQLLKEAAVVLPDPGRAPALGARLAEGEKLLAANAAKARQILADLLKETDLGPLEQRTLLALARAQARQKDWKALRATLARRGADSNPTNAAYAKLLAVLADEGNRANAADLLKPLAELGRSPQAVAELDPWEQAEYQRLRGRVTADVVALAGQRRKAGQADEALALVRQALAFEPNHAPALVLQADLQLRKGEQGGPSSLDENSLAAFGKVAEQAIELDRLFPDAHHLQASVLLLQSRQKNAKARAEYLAKALEANDRALGLYKKQADQARLPDLLTTRSTNCTELANFTSDPAKRADLLHQAVADARGALKWEDRSYPEYAWTALGIALEDLAWLIEEEPEKNYAVAVEAFAQAIKLRPKSPRVWIDRGRCRFNQARLTQEAMRFAPAREDLDRAIDLHREAHGDAPTTLLADAYYTRARVNSAANDFESAQRDYLAAIAAAKQAKSPDEAVYALGYAEVALAQARTLPAGNDRTQLLADVRQRAQDLWSAEQAPQKTSWLVAQTYELERKYQEAYNAYTKALPLAQVAAADLGQLDILLARANLLLANGKALKDVKEPAELARKDALQAVKLAGAPQTLGKAKLAEIYGVCGLAYQALSLQTKGAVRTENNNKAYDYLKKAVNTAGDHADAWVWNLGLAQTYGRPLVDPELKPATEATFNGWKKQAIQHAEAARDGAPAADKPKIDGLIKSLQKLAFQ